MPKKRPNESFRIPSAKRNRQRPQHVQSTTIASTQLHQSEHENAKVERSDSIGRGSSYDIPGNSQVDIRQEEQEHVVSTTASIKQEGEHQDENSPSNALKEEVVEGRDTGNATSVKQEDEANVTPITDIRVKKEERDEEHKEEDDEEGEEEDDKDEKPRMKQDEEGIEAVRNRSETKKEKSEEGEEDDGEDQCKEDAAEGMSTDTADVNEEQEEDNDHEEQEEKEGEEESEYEGGQIQGEEEKEEHNQVGENINRKADGEGESEDEENEDVEEQEQQQNQLITSHAVVVSSESPNSAFEELVVGRLQSVATMFETLDFLLDCNLHEHPIVRNKLVDADICNVLMSTTTKMLKTTRVRTDSKKTPPRTENNTAQSKILKVIDTFIRFAFPSTTIQASGATDTGSNGNSGIQSLYDLTVYILRDTQKTERILDFLLSCDISHATSIRESVRDSFLGTNICHVLKDTMNALVDEPAEGINVKDTIRKLLIFIMHLTYEGEMFCEKFFTAAVHHTIIKVMTTYPEQNLIQYYGCGALGNILAYSLQHVKENVTDLKDIINVATKCLRRFSCLQDKSLFDLVYDCLVNIYVNYKDERPSTILWTVEGGSIESTLKIMKRYPSHQIIQGNGCVLLKHNLKYHNLGQDHCLCTKMKEHIHDNGGIRILSNILKGDKKQAQAIHNRTMAREIMDMYNTKC